MNTVSVCPSSCASISCSCWRHGERSTSSGSSHGVGVHGDHGARTRSTRGSTSLGGQGVNTLQPPQILWDHRTHGVGSTGTTTGPPVRTNHRHPHLSPVFPPNPPRVLPNLSWKQQHPQLWAHSSHTSSSRGSPTLCSQAPTTPCVAQNPAYPCRTPRVPRKVPGAPKPCSDSTHSTRCPGAHVPQPRPPAGPHGPRPVPHLCWKRSLMDTQTSK